MITPLDMAIVVQQRDETIRQMSEQLTDYAMQIAERDEEIVNYQNELKVRDRHADKMSRDLERSRFLHAIASEQLRIAERRFDNIAKYLDELQAARLLIDDTTSVPDAIMLYQERNRQLEERIQQLEAHVKQLGGRLADATAENIALQQAGNTTVLRWYPPENAV